MGTIYVLRNRLNGKCYVGQTRNPEKRFAYYRCPGKERKTLIERAIGKYGWDAFERICFDGIPQETIDHCERELIRKLNSQKPTGYNLEGGGCGLKQHHPESNAKRSRAMMGSNHPLFGTHLSQAAKDHLSDFWKGKTFSIETRRKLSEANRGKKRTPEMKLANSLWHLGKNIGAMNCQSIKIVCLETKEIFDCISDAARKYQINRGHIGACCAGKLKSCGGMHWAFVEKRSA
jgi:group I intron endonuclease